MLDNTKYITYNYQDFTNGIERILKSIESSEWKPDIIVGVVRGGCIPAIYLSHRLGVPVQMVHYSTIDDSSHKDLCPWISEQLNNNKKILLVEDIVDSGKTLIDILGSWEKNLKKQEKLNNVKLAALVANKTQPVYVDYYDYMIDRDNEFRWFIFPWE